jgi:tetratricopeptide (TPR) repeat protein
MRLTSSFAVFRSQPGEQDLGKPRWLAGEGKIAAAEEEYRKALGRNPDIYAGWLELFELLRRDGRSQQALELADAAERHWGPDAAMPHTLRGAALVELGRITDGLGELQRAIGLDGALAVAWHEYGYASYRAGHHSEALLALDRAFGLEAHTDTLMLRGHILREGGRYDAAEVAFEAAAQATDHDMPRRDAEREVLATRRAAALGGKRPRDFTARERWFARDGGILLLAPDQAETPGDSMARAVGALVALARELPWRPAAVAGARADDQVLAENVAGMLGVPALGASALAPAHAPLVVTVRNDGREEWAKQLDRLARWRTGCCFALVQRPDTPNGADVVGVGADVPQGDVDRDLTEALRRAPEAAAAPTPEILTLARHPLAAWRQRSADSAPG